MASLKDVAKKAGVSTATVSRVINNHPSVSWEVRRVVHEAMNELSYLPNKSSISLDGKRSGILGCIVPNLTNPHFSELIMILEQEARFYGMDLIVKTHLNQSELEKNALSSFIALGIEGLFWVPTENECELVDIVRRSGVFTVVVTQRSKFFNSILVDYRDGMRKAALHIKEQGWKCAGFVGQNTVDVEKFSVFKESLDDFPLVCKLEKKGVFWLEKGLCESLNFNSNESSTDDNILHHHTKLGKNTKTSDVTSVERSNKNLLHTDDNNEISVFDHEISNNAVTRGNDISSLENNEGLEFDENFEFVKEQANYNQSIGRENHHAKLLEQHIDQVVAYLLERKVKQEPPIILWVFNDVCALAIEQACLKAWLRYSQDFGLISFDNTYLTQILNISSIGQPIREIAKRSYCLVADFHRKYKRVAVDCNEVNNRTNKDKLTSITEEEIECIELKPTLYSRESSRLL